MELVQIRSNCLSGLSAIAVDKKSGDRRTFSNPGVNDSLEIVAEKLKDADFISVTDLSGDWKKIMDEILEMAEQNKVSSLWTAIHAT